MGALKDEMKTTISDRVAIHSIWQHLESAGVIYTGETCSFLLVIEEGGYFVLLIEGRPCFMLLIEEKIFWSAVARGIGVHQLRLRKAVTLL